MNPVQDPSYRIRSSPDFLLCLPPHYRKYFGREVLVTDKFIYSFFKRVSIVTAPPPHPSIVTAPPSSTPLEQNASSLVCHCKNSELQKAGLLPIPCVSLITGTGGQEMCCPWTQCRCISIQTPSKTLHHLCVCGGGGGGGKWERLDSLSPPPPPKKKKRQVSEWSCVSSAQELSDLSHAHSHTLIFCGQKYAIFVQKHVWICGGWSFIPPPPPPPLFYSSNPTWPKQRTWFGSTPARI